MLLIIYLFDYYAKYLWLFYLLYGMATTLFAYCISLYCNEMLAQNIITGLYFAIGTFSGSFLLFFKLYYNFKDVVDILAYIFRLIPLFCLSNGYATLKNKNAVYYLNNANAINTICHLLW